MLKTFSLVISTVLGLLAIVLPSVANPLESSVPPADMQVQLSQAATTATATPTADKGRTERARRRAPRRGGNPAPCPACGMG